MYSKFVILDLDKLLLFKKCQIYLTWKINFNGYLFCREKNILKRMAWMGKKNNPPKYILVKMAWKNQQANTNDICS